MHQTLLDAKNMANVDTFSDILFKFCKNLSVSITDETAKNPDKLKGLCSFAFVLNMNIVDDIREKLATRLGGVDYIDTQTLIRMRKTCANHSNMLGNIDMCLFALTLFDFSNVLRVEEKDGNFLPMNSEQELIHKIHKDILGKLTVQARESGWILSDTCRACLICSMEGIKRQAALSEYCTRNSKNIHDMCLGELFEYLVDLKSNPAQFSSLLHWMFSKSTFQGGGVSECIVIANKLILEVGSVKHRKKSNGKSRPSILEVIRNMAETNITDQNADIDTYQRFCTKMGFSNTMPSSVKRRTYFIMCQPHLWNPLEILEEFVSRDFVEKAAEIKVLTPNSTDISEIITTFQFCGKPFPELEKFRKLFLMDFVEDILKNLNLTEIFQLYLTAYQDVNIWRTVWKIVRPRGRDANALIRDVEQFVSENKFNVKKVLDSLSC